MNKGKAGLLAGRAKHAAAEDDITFHIRFSTFFWLCLALAAAALFSRAPGHLTAPELWAEDGSIWVHDAYANGWVSLFWPRVGYLQTVSRLGALLGITLLPFTALPLFFALVAFLVQLAPAALILSRRGAGLIPSLPARLVLVAYYIGQPNSAEVYVNLTNAMWHLALLAFLIAVLPKPRGVLGLTFDIAALVLAGLSGPLVLLTAPIAWWHVRERRGEPDARPRIAYAGVLSACALIQGGVLLTGAGNPRLPPNLGVTLDRLFHIFADQIVLGGSLGGTVVNMMLGHVWWLHTLPAALCCLAACLLGLVAFVRGPAAYRQIVVMSALLMASALKSPIITRAMPQWIPMQSPGIGDRYYIIPMLAWFATLLVLACGPGWLRWLARGLIALCLIGVIYDWSYQPYVTTGYQAAARQFDAAPAGTVITFPENPAPWAFVLTKR